MKPIFAIAAAATAVAGTLPACAQTQPNIAVAPAHRSTGPTILDTRSIEQNTALPSSSTSQSNGHPHGNWRMSDGLNTDAIDPSGASGRNSGLGTSPTR